MPKQRPPAAPSLFAFHLHSAALSFHPGRSLWGSPLLTSETQFEAMTRPEAKARVAEGTPAAPQAGDGEYC